MTEETQKAIRNELDKLRTNPNFYIRSRNMRPFEYYEDLKGNVIDVIKNQNLLTTLASYDFPILPKYVSNFIMYLTESLKLESIFDPCIRLGSPINSLNASSKNGFVWNFEEKKLIDLIHPNSYKLSEPLAGLDLQNGTFDLVCSHPPFIPERKTEQVNNRSVSDTWTNIFLFKACLHLAVNGIGLFILPKSFLNKTSTSILNDFGFFVNAVFDLPAEIFAPYNSILSNLVLVSRNSTSKTFAAEISANESNNKIVAQNFNNNKVGKLTSLGVFVDLNTFYSIQKLNREKQINESLLRLGFPIVSLSELATIKTIKVDSKEKVLHTLNSIYLPKIGNGPVVMHPEEMIIKPHNYLHIELDDGKVLDSYITNFLNSQIGKIIRETYTLGSILPKISIASLKDILVSLPDLETQSRMLQVDSLIQQFSYKLSQFRSELWKYPKKVKAIEKEIQAINREEKLQDWIEKLPFPLASILWRYYATKDNGKKIEHLFHFYEAFSEFLCVLLLSAYVQDKNFYESESHNWIETEEKYRDWYLRASFGGWNTLFSKLASATRGYIDPQNKEKNEICKSLFGFPSNDFFKLVTSRSIGTLLKEIADYRNKWKGHGGIKSKTEDEKRVAILGGKLEELKKLIGYGFHDVKLLSPTPTSPYSNGVFLHIVKSLVGTRTPFNEIEVQTILPMDIQKIYVLHSNQNKPIELLPLIRFVGQEACYFYTSRENAGIRWISYHFEEEPEFVKPDAELDKLLKILKPK